MTRITAFNAVTYAITELVQTCDACPSQWSGKTEDGQAIYIRYCFGWLIAEIADEVVFSGNYGDALDGILTTRAMLTLLEQNGVVFTVRPVSRFN